MKALYFIVGFGLQLDPPPTHGKMRKKPNLSVSPDGNKQANACLTELYNIELNRTTLYIFNKPMTIVLTNGITAEQQTS